MLDNNSLIKYFVRVPSGITFNGAQVSNANATNQKKIYFDENTQQIWVKGKSFSLDKDIATAVSTLIGSDTNKSVRTIAGEVVTTALNLTDNADKTINTLKEVLNWFNNLPEGDEGALALVERVGKPAELYTAADEQANPEHVEGTVKTAATGIYKVIEDSIGAIDYSSFATKSEVNTKIGSLGNKVEAAEATYYTAEDEEVKAGTKQVGDVKTPAVTAVPYTNVMEVITDNERVVANSLNELNERVNTLSAGGITNVKIGTTDVSVSDNTATITKSDLQAELFDNTYASSPLSYSYLGVTISAKESNGELTEFKVDPSELANRVSAVEEFDPWEEYSAPAEPGE